MHRPLSMILKVIYVNCSRKRQRARADVRVTIEETLDQGLPGCYTPDL